MAKAKQNKIYYFEQASIPKAFFALAVPTVISQLISIAYNYADTWFIGRLNDPAILAAVNVSMPAFILLSAIANLFGVGGSALIARFLGLRKENRARNTFAFSFFFGLLVGGIYALTLFLLRGWIIPLIGGTSETYRYIEQYLFFTTVLGGIPLVTNNLLGHLVRGTGASKEAGFGMGLGALLNIALDPLFMFVILKDYPLAGAAVATMLANCVAALYFIIYLLRHKENPVYTLSIKDISFQEKIPSSVLFIGFPAALGTSLAMLSNIAANSLMAPYGEVPQAGLGLAKKANTLAFGVCMGITQGMLPFLSYNYAQENYQRMKEGMGFMLLIALLYSFVTMTLYLMIPEAFISFFTGDEPTIENGVKFLRIIALAVPTCAFCYSANVIFQATGKKWRSLILSVLRKGLFDIPLMFFFNSLWGASGILFATPIAEIAAVIVCLSMLIPFYKTLKNH